MKIRTLFILSLGLALAGCGSEPSEADIETALTAQFEKAKPLLALTGGKITLHSVSKQSCSKIDKIWECYVTVDVTAPIVGRNSSTDRILLIKGDSGWIALDNNGQR